MSHAEELPTSILGMYTEDAERTQVLLQMGRHDPNFTAVEANPNVTDMFWDDVQRRYQDPTQALYARRMFDYEKLVRKQQEAGPIIGTLLAAELFIRRNLEPGTRSAHKAGLVRS